MSSDSDFLGRNPNGLAIFQNCRVRQDVMDRKLVTTWDGGGNLDSLFVDHDVSADCQRLGRDRDIVAGVQSDEFWHLVMAAARIGRHDC